MFHWILRLGLPDGIRNYVIDTVHLSYCNFIKKIENSKRKEGELKCVK